MAHPPHDLEVDASGLACPMPIVKAKKGLATLSSGQVLKLIGTDPGSLDDMPAFAESGGHTLLSATETDGHYVFLIRKA
jgi:tRNA 2-thiouridine synthesizing protein A